jgi:hypothetical protein
LKDNSSLFDLKHILLILKPRSNFISTSKRHKELVESRELKNNPKSELRSNPKILLRSNPKIVDLGGSTMPKNNLLKIGNEAMEHGILCSPFSNHHPQVTL